MDLLLHPAEDAERQRPDPRGRLSTAGHGAAFRAFVRVARRAKVSFIIIGGTYRDYVILKLLAADADTRRRGRDLVDIQFALDAHDEHAEGKLSIPALRARLQDVYGVGGEKLRRLVTLLRAVPQPKA